MMSQFKNCWEHKQCGREKGGAKVAELGECIASTNGLGHSCWAIAGTLCGGTVQGTAAQKEQNCLAIVVPELILYTHVFSIAAKRFPMLLLLLQVGHDATCDLHDR